MPKVLIFNDCWIFIIWDTDQNENKKHVHVGKKATVNLCKIWIDDVVEIAKPGDLTIKQQKELLDVAKKYQKQLIQQWDNFMIGKTIKTIKVRSL